MVIHCDRDMLDNPVVMDFLQREDLCNIPENVGKLMAPYSKDWTGPNAVTSEREQDPGELTREDQLYLLTAFELHHYWKSRMRALSLTKTFEPEYDEIATKLKEVVRVSNSIRDSVSLLNVLGFILFVGNFMNDANKQATGFKISSLNRLGMVKDGSNETTFADFVERSIRNKWPEWEGFIEDIGGVVVAQKINVDQLITDAKKYIDNISNVQASLDNGNLSDPGKFHPEDRVSMVVQRSMKDARRKAEQLKLYLEEMQASYKDIMVFFGEDATDDDARRTFFSKFAEFVVEWKVSAANGFGQAAPGQPADLYAEIQREELRFGGNSTPQRRQHETKGQRACANFDIRIQHRRPAIAGQQRSYGRLARQVARSQTRGTRSARPAAARQVKGPARRPCGVRAEDAGDGCAGQGSRRSRR